jgi:hypothetical protein
MTRRDFILLSDALRAARERIKTGKHYAALPTEHRTHLQDGVRKAACHIADAIREDNPTFDAQRFLVDCGYGGTNG